MNNGIHLVPGLYTVRPRAGKRYVRPELEALAGKVFRFRPGFDLTDQAGGIFGGEHAMVSVDDDTGHPYPEGAPVWIPARDLEPYDLRPYELTPSHQRKPDDLALFPA